MSKKTISGFYTSNSNNTVYLDDLGFPDDFTIIKESRQSWVDKIYAKNVAYAKSTEREIFVSWDRIAMIWDAYNESDNNISCAYTEALLKYPKEHFYNGERSYKSFKAFYIIERVDELTYHCYLSELGLETKGLIY